ncbi:hypothetical protein PINS_up023057 [Pythium insidiosum]|nr:hypothetical protein PINS_up023057 [Pythium insidiosum]
MTSHSWRATLRCLAGLTVVAAALVLAPSTASSSAEVATVDIDLSTLNDTSTWTPLTQRHLDGFFERPKFSLSSHVQAFRARRQRRLEAAASEARSRQHARRLAPGSCAEALKSLSNEFDTDVKGKFKTLIKLLEPKFDVKNVFKELPDFGAKLRKFNFAALGHGLLDAFDVGFFVKDLVTLEKDVQEMVAQAKAVIDKIREAEQIIRNIGNTILDRMERRDFEHFLNAAVASANAVLKSEAKTKDQHFAVCRAFDYTTITKLSNSMQNYQLCTNGTDTTAQQKCRFTVGLAASSALMQSLSAAAFCDAHFVIAQTHSSYPLSLLQQDAQNLLADLMQILMNGNEKKDEFKDAKQSLDQFRTEIEAFVSNATAVDDPDSPDAYMKTVLADLHSRTLTTTAAIGSYTASELYRNMTATNRAAGAAGQIVGLAVAKSQKQVKDKLVNLGDKVVSQHQERMGMYDTINSTIWTNHGEFMGQVGKMSTQFTAQHGERMGRLQNVQQNLGNVQSATTDGFGRLRGKIQDMGRHFVTQVQTIENNAIATGAETTTILSDAVVSATREVESRINGVGETLLRNHAQVMSAISNAQDTAVNEFSATQDLLFSASDRLRQAIDGGLGAVESTANAAFGKINDVVAKRMEESFTVLDGIMAGMSSEFSRIDDRLVVLYDRAANMSRQLDIAKDFLRDIHLKFEVVQQMLDALPAVVQRELFQSDVDGLHRQYMNMRKAYRTYLDSDLPVKTLVESCVSFQVYDLFLRFLRLVDVSDEELPDMLNNFAFSRSSYERFGIMVVGVLNELAFLDGVCAKVQFSATMADVEAKAQEQADLILRASARFAYHVEEVIPAYVLANRVPTEVEAVSPLAWEVNGFQAAEDLRKKLQDQVGDFASVTVIHAGVGADAKLNVDHLDRDAALDARDKPRRAGIYVSRDAKLAVLWGQTPLLPDDRVAGANATELLRQGILRGNVSSTKAPSGCFLAGPRDVYPRCKDCTCVHYEDFASTTDPMAGRAVTYLAEKTYDSDFVVESVFSAGVDYTLLFVQLNIGSLAGMAATAALQADVVAASSPDAPPQPVLWEGLTTSGRFDVVPGGIRGTVLRENELVLTLTQGATQMRLPFSLFCDGQSKLIRLAQPELELRYACTQTRRATSPAALAKAGFPIVSPGLPVKRLERAVCSQDPTRRSCKARGAVALSEHRAADGGVATTKPTLRFGAAVPDITLFTDAGFRGTFAICRACSPQELEVLTQRLPFTGAILGIPDPPADMLNVQCAEPQIGTGSSTMQLVMCSALPSTR